MKNEIKKVYYVKRTTLDNLGLHDVFLCIEGWNFWKFDFLFRRANALARNANLGAWGFNLSDTATSLIGEKTLS